MFKSIKMRKNGRLISLRQYKLTDLFFFAVVLAVSDLLVFCATKFWFKDVADYYISFMLPIALTVIMRWGFWGVFYSVIDGIVLCTMQGGSWQSYIIYIIGNAFILAVLLLTKFLGKERIRTKWYFSLLYVFTGWVSVNFALTVAGVCFGESFLTLAGRNFGLGVYGALSFAMAVVTVMILRRLNGMFEDQKHYLLRQDKERKELARRDEFGDEPVEIDEESLSILKRWDDGLDK